MTINPIDNQPFTTQDADRLLGLADAFLEDWEQHEGADDPECAERRREYDAIRPLLVAAPAMQAVVTAAEKLVTAKGRFHTEQNYRDLADKLTHLKEFP